MAWQAWQNDNKQLYKQVTLDRTTDGPDEILLKYVHQNIILRAKI